MKSRAAIGNHPLHPALVPLPIGAFFLVLVGDIIHSARGDEFWYRFSLACLGLGIITALMAAVFGFIDYFGVKMSAAGRKVATTHMLLNLSGVVLYAINFFLRLNGGALNNNRWPLVFGLEAVTFLALLVSGWLGGKLAYEHKVGVVEWTDREAGEIGQREPHQAPRSY